MVKKLPGVQQFRDFWEVIIQMIPWPNINPNYVTIAQIIPSIFAAIYYSNKFLVLILLIITLFLDLADGAIAKKHKKTSKHGYYMDLFFDRLSETIIFLPLMNWWLILAVLNSLLSIFSVKKNIHVSLPLRQAYALYLLFLLIL